MALAMTTQKSPSQLKLFDSPTISVENLIDISYSVGKERYIAKRKIRQGAALWCLRQYFCDK